MRRHDEPVASIHHEVNAATHAIRNDDRQSEVHRLVNNETPRLVVARYKGKEVPRCVRACNVLLIKETREYDIGDFFCRNLPPHFLLERASTDNEERAPYIRSHSPKSFK
jgi:hypothetical protein